MTTYGLYSKIYFLKPGFKDFHQRISVLFFEIMSHSPLSFSMILAYTLLPNVSTYFHLHASHILLLKGNDFFPTPHYLHPIQFMSCAFGQQFFHIPTAKVNFPSLKPAFHCILTTYQSLPVVSL